MIKIGGKEILPMTEDLVLDVLDMIDGYHGYESLCESLWSVLDAVIGTMDIDPPRPVAPGRGAWPLHAGLWHHTD